MTIHTLRSEFRLSEKDSAHYFSNAAALYVLGVGFCVFAVKAQSLLMMGTCFWFSVFMLCDCFRLARVCRRLSATNNLLLVLDREGITHFGSWMWPEQVSWKEISGFRFFKTPQSETVYFQTSRAPKNFFRYVFFGAPKFDLPLDCVKGGREGLLQLLDTLPEARHLVPERAGLEEQLNAA